MGVERRLRWRKGLRIASLVVLGLLLACELGLRVAGPVFDPPPLRFVFANRMTALIDERSTFQASPTLFWEPRPGAVVAGEERIGPDGLRGPGVPRERAAGELRVAVLGDSCTFGIGVEYVQTYGAVLERRLAERLPGRPVRVINGGVPGYTLFQGLRFFDERVAPLAPDVAVLYYGVWNEYAPALAGPDSEIARTGVDPPHSLVERAAGIARCSRLFEAFLARYAGTLRHRHWRAAVNEWMAGEPSGGYRVPLEEFGALLEDLLGRCEALGTRVVIVLPELNHDAVGDQPIQLERLERYRSCLSAATAERGLPVVDLRALLQDRPGAELFVDLVHPGPEAHARLAAALEERLVQAGWLAP